MTMTTKVEPMETGWLRDGAADVAVAEVPATPVGPPKPPPPHTETLSIRWAGYSVVGECPQTRRPIGRNQFAVFTFAAALSIEAAREAEPTLAAIVEKLNALPAPTTPTDRE